MKRSLWILFAIAMVSLLPAGCYKKVIHTSTGESYCPYPEESGKKLVYHKVQPHTDFCEHCKKHFRWTDNSNISWACKGKAACPDCHGSGKVYDPEGTHNKCSYCGGSGKCFDSGPGGHSLWGNSPIRLYNQRGKLRQEEKDDGAYPR